MVASGVIRGTELVWIAVAVAGDVVAAGAWTAAAVWSFVVRRSLTRQAMAAGTPAVARRSTVCLASGRLAAAFVVASVVAVIGYLAQIQHTSATTPALLIAAVACGFGAIGCAVTYGFAVADGNAEARTRLEQCAAPGSDRYPAF